MRNIFLFIFLVSFVCSAFSQPQRPTRQGTMLPDERREAIEARKIAYITKQLELTPDEARLFWPIYNEYNKKVDALAETFRIEREQMPEVTAMSEAEATHYINQDLKRFESAAALRRQYTEQMIEVISVQKVARLFEAEKSFNRMLFREAQRRHRMDGRRE